MVWGSICGNVSYNISSVCNVDVIPTELHNIGHCLKIILLPCYCFLSRIQGEHHCGTSLIGKAPTPLTMTMRRWWHLIWVTCYSCCLLQEPTTRWQIQRMNGTCFMMSWTISMRFTYSCHSQSPIPPWTPNSTPTCILDIRMNCLVQVMDSSFSPPPVLWQCL